MAGEELLHGGLFEVALLGDEPVQPAQQPIHIAQRRRDGALFGRGTATVESKISPNLHQRLAAERRPAASLIIRAQIVELK